MGDGTEQRNVLNGNGVLAGPVPLPSRGGVRSACRRAVISARVCGAIARLCLTNGE